MRRSQRLFDVASDRPQDTYAFGFLVSLGYEAAWHMDELPDRTTPARGPDMTFTLFRDTVWYDPGAVHARQLTAHADAFPAARVPDLGALVEAAAARTVADDGGPCPEAPAPRSVRDTVARDTFLEWWPLPGAHPGRRHLPDPDRPSHRRRHGVDPRRGLPAAAVP